MDLRLPILARLPSALRLGLEESSPKSDLRFDPVGRARSQSSIINHQSSMRRAFSFTEILFAVMILGIGFIMVAAMFPVAIQQTQATNDETVAASVGRIGTSYMQQLAQIRVVPSLTDPMVGHAMLAANQATSVLYPTIGTNRLAIVDALRNNPPPPTGPVAPITVAGEVWSLHEDPNTDRSTVFRAYPGTNTGAQPLMPHPLAMWQAVSSNLIMATDQRFGWVGMYKRDVIVQYDQSLQRYVATPSPIAQVFILVTQERNKPVYDDRDAAHYPNQFSAFPATLEPQLLLPGTVNISHQPGGASELRITGNGVFRVAEGAYVIVANDGGTGALNGRILRIGVQPDSTNPGRWQLAPGGELAPNDPNLGGATVLIVGRGYSDPTNPAPNANAFKGGAQDTAIYTSFVSVN
jgi:hypothetical protein